MYPPLCNYFNPPSSLTMKRFRSLSPCLRNGRLRRRQPPHGGGGGGVGAAQENEEIVLLNNAVFSDVNIVDRITPCLATSPSCQDNGIACCSRATNVAWRRMFFPLSLDFLQHIMKYVHKPESHKGTISLLLADYADIHGIETRALKQEH